MPMPLPANAVTIGENAYLFPSPSDNPVTDCFIMGHGGTPRDSDRYFTVPAGCTVNFFVAGGKPHNMDGGPVTGFTVIAGKNGGQAPEIKPGNSFGGGKNCRDYILAKAFGYHWKGETGGFDDYTSINHALNDLAGPHAGLQWLPHYVSIRNRTSWVCNTNVWLSRVIKEIRDYEVTIVNFYCGNCRSYLYDEKAKELVKSAGTQAFL